MTLVGMEIPRAVLAFAERGPEWASYVRRLPGAVRDLLREWDLTPDGSPMNGHGSLVLPVRHDENGPLALKVAFLDPETEHEHLTLGAWDGDGAVRLVRADPSRGALLLERAGPDDLSGLPVLQACEVVARLYATLHVPAPGRLPSLRRFIGGWHDDLADHAERLPVPRRLVQQALSLGQSFIGDPASEGIAIHADLHDENVLSSRRDDGAAWLAIDPKGVSGDPHYEPAPMLWNRWDDAVATGDVRTAVRRRFHTLVDVAGLEEERARDWVVVRMVHNALWAVQDAERQRRSLTAEDRDWITTCVAVAKAVQD